MFCRKKIEYRDERPKHSITVQTDYGSFEIINLKRVWINKYFGTYRLMYQDDIYEYNCIYWSNSASSQKHYSDLKEKLLNAYNKGNLFIEL